MPESIYDFCEGPACPRLAKKFLANKGLCDDHYTALVETIEVRLVELEVSHA